MSKTISGYLSRRAAGLYSMTKRRWKKLRGKERHGGLAPRRPNTTARAALAKETKR